MAKSKYITIEDAKMATFTKKAVGQAYGTSLRPDVYYIVASVELGNTTTKCILTATNLNTSRTYLLDKTVKITRDIRPPKKGERVFGETVWHVELTKETVSEMVRDTILESIKRSKIDIEMDLDFVVRSTGVTAGFASPEEVGELIIALADGCLDPDAPARVSGEGSMRPAMIVTIALAVAPAAAYDKLPTPASAEICGDCHRAIAEGWKKSAHARAMESRLFLEALRKAAEDFGADARKVCLGCHAPLAVKLGDFDLVRKTSWEGVT